MSDAHPPRQDLAPEQVLAAMAEEGSQRVRGLNPLRVVLLAVVGGAFITFGAWLSILLAEGVETAGLARLLEGIGFSVGFFFVVLSGTVLFSESNTILSVVLLRDRASVGLVLRFWAVAWVGNLIGAITLGPLIVWTQSPAADTAFLLSEMIDAKMSIAVDRDARAISRVVASGFLANWLIGMAAFFATMARTVLGKYVPLLLAVILFVAANFQHSPANMGYFALATSLGVGPGWMEAMLWNIIPAGVGNVLGGAIPVACMFAYAMRPLENPRKETIRP